MWSDCVLGQGLLEAMLGFFTSEIASIKCLLLDCLLEKLSSCVLDIFNFSVHVGHGIFDFIWENSHIAPIRTLPGGIDH